MLDAQPPVPAVSEAPWLGATQSELRRFYDTICVRPATARLASWRLSRAERLAVERRQLAALVRLEFGGLPPAVVKHRATGSLTASRVAGTRASRSWQVHSSQNRVAACSWEHASTTSSYADAM